MYTEEGLALRRKRPWRHATAVRREQRRPASADIWSMDFVADELADGRRFRTLTILDLFTRECLEMAVGRGLTGQDVVRALERLRFERGLPERIDCDNGTEFISAAMDLWADPNGGQGRVGRGDSRAGESRRGYNFVRAHQTLRVTPAMEAGLTCRVWSVADIVALLDAAEKKAA